MDGPPSISARRMERTDIDSAAGSIVAIRMCSVRKRSATLCSLGVYDKRNQVKIGSTAILRQRNVRTLSFRVLKAPST